MPQATAAPTTPKLDTAADRQIWRAKQLEADRQEILDDIDGNRQYLRLMEKGGELSAEQIEWLHVFYPLKSSDEKRSKDEIVATREAKIAAVKEVKAADKK